MHTVITIERKDNTVRVIKCVGNWSYTMAESLGRDLEKDNYKTIKIEK